MDDGKCHICRQWPAREDPMYSITTCMSCDESVRSSSNNGLAVICTFLAIIAFMWVIHG